MALKLKYKDEHGVLSIDVSPGSSPPRAAPPPPPPRDQLAGPKFDTINSRFGRCDLFGGKYDGGEAPRSLFRSRYNSVEEELANTPYAFAAERSLRAAGPRLQLELHQPRADFADYGEHRFCTSDSSLFGPRVDLARTSDEEETPAFTVTQLIHAQDRYYDLSSRQSCDSPAAKPLGRTVRAVADSYEVRSAPASARKPSTRGDGDAAADAFRVLPGDSLRSAQPASANLPVVPTSKRKREKSFAIIAEPVISRPSSPRSLPVDIRPGAGRVSPFKGRGFREETSRHNTPKTSAANSRSCSPSKKRSSSQENSDKMAQVATIPPTSILSRPRSPRNFLRENMKEVKELSELNREKHEAEAEVKRQQEEEALLKEMGLLDKPTTRSRTGSRTNSRSNSPSKINLRSRSNSPSAILQFESMPKAKVSNELTTPTGRKQKPTTHRSRVSSISKSQPQSNDGSPKTSKIPKRQNSVSPASNKRNFISYRRPFDNTLNKNQRFISNSTSSIHETIRIGSQVHDKRAISQSDQFLDISPNNILSKPPISPGRGGPPPSNRSISTKRLSPIVGTPNKSLDDLKSSSTKTTPRPSPAARKSIKTAGTAPSTSRVIPRQLNKTASRDPSPDKKGLSKVTVNSKVSQNKNLSKISNSKTTQNPPLGNKTDQKKSISRTNSVKSLTSTQSTKNINEKSSLMKTKDKKNELNDKTKSNNKVQKTEVIKTSNDNLKPVNTKDESAVAQQETTTNDFDTKDEVEKSKQDNETQYDKITNEKGDLVILTKKNVVSMTTAAITAQPLEVVTTVTNQLPAALEKAREKGIFERLGSKDSLAPKEEGKEVHMVNIETNKQTTINGFTELKDITVTKEEKNGRHDDKKPPKTTKTLYGDESVKLKLLQPPYNNPQVERVKQKIDSILKEPEISTENILTSVKKIEERVKEDVAKNIFPKTKPELLDTKIKSEFNVNDIKDEVEKENEKISAEIRSEATKIIDSIITPVEEPIGVADKHKGATKENIEPIVMVVNEKSKIEPKRTDIVKVNQNLVKGDAEVEVQSSNVSTPGVEKITLATTAAGGSVSDKSATSNGGFPQSTSTTPKPPPRIQRQAKMETQSPQPDGEKESPPADKKPNICSRLMGKCKTKCCSCCAKPKEDDEQTQTEAKDMTKEVTEESVDVKKEQKKGVFSKLNCFKKKEAQKEEAVAEMGAGKAATIEFESERKHKRKLRDVVCAWCRRGRVRDSAGPPPARRVADVAGVDVSPPTVTTAGCCGGRRRDVQRRDSILSDSAHNTCCNYRLCQWVRGACRRKSEPASSPRTSLFSKNKSLSPTLPPEDTRTKLDPSLVEHTSVMRGAIPVLPISLAYFCLFCNILVPGLGTIFSGLFCLCFGIPRFGIHDSPRHRIGSFVINLLVGCGQLFTVLFCLVGWGWSIWWGTIMVRTSRKYRKLKAEASLEEAEAAPPVTTNNHTRT